MHRDSSAAAPPLAAVTLADLSGRTPEGFLMAQMPDLLGGFTELLGLEFLETSGERVVLRWKVRPELLQPWGILHGGVHSSVVETAASIGAALWFGERGQVVGVSNSTDFLRAVREGELTARAVPVHRGRRQQLWLVEITDESDRLVARGQVRLHNLPSASAPG